MAKKNKKQVFNWQPEIATSIIYWSLTLGTFFASVIIYLEALKINLFCGGTFLIFCGLVYFGGSRHIKLDDKELSIKSILKKNRHRYDIETIGKVSVGSFGITIHPKESVHYPIEEFLMSKKTKLEFIKTLKQLESFNGQVVSVEKKNEI